MRRPALKITVFLAILLLGLGLASYVLLQTALPGKWILAAVNSELGLSVTAESVSVGWMGHSRVHNVSIMLPLSDEELLSAAAIEFSHRALPWLLLTRSLGLDAVRIDGPNLHVRGDERGRWNVQDAWTRIDAGRRPDGQSSARIALPRLEVHNGTVRITDANGSSETIGPLNFEGRPESRSLWAFTLDATPQMEAKGQLAQGHDWSHAVGFDLTAPEPLLQVLHEPNVAPVQLSGRWEGRLAGSELGGRLELDRLRAGNVVLAGTVDVTAGPEGVTLRPVALVMSEPNLAGAPLQLTSGAVRASGTEVRAERLGVQAGPFTARLDGHWGNAGGTGTITGSWMIARTADETKYQGTCQIALRSPPAGRKEADVTLAARIETSAGPADVTAILHGEGASWQGSTWDLSVPKCAWYDGGKQYDLSGIVAEVALNWPQVQLTSLNLPNARQVQAVAQLEAASWLWSAQIDVQGLRPRSGQTGSLDLHFEGTGDRDKVVVSEFSATQADRTLAAQGELVLSERSIRTAHVSARWSVAGPDPSAQTAPKEPGLWHGEADITGKVQPLALKVKGVLAGTNVPLGRQVVRDVNIPMQADVDAARVALATEPFTLLDGQWQISGRHEWSNTLTQLSLTLNKMSLKSAADMAGSPLTCRGRVKAELQLAAPGFDLHGAVAFGSWSAEKVEIASLRAETARGKIRIANGLVRFDEIRVDQEAGQAEGNMQFGLDRPQLLSFAFTAKAWPLQLDQRAPALRLDGTADVQLDVLARTLNGQGQLSGDLLWQEEQLGRLALSATVRERTLSIQELHAEALGGTIEGTAEIPLDQWTISTGRLQWQEIEPNALEPWWPTMSRVQGHLSGSLTAVQAKDEDRPPEPMRLDLRAEMPDGRIGTSELRDGHVVAYLGPRRLLIDQANFRLLGGQVDARVRVTPHIEKLYATVILDANDLDLNQLVCVVNPQAGQIAGRLSGGGNLLFSSDLSSFSGAADLNLSQSDLANNRVVRTLFDAMNLNLGKKEPQGAGQMRIQLDGVRAQIPSFVYFNRGVEIRGAGQIENFRLGSASAVDGYAFGSTRILKGITLPGVKELDRLMSSLQTGAASVRIEGTVGEPKVALVPLPSLSDPLRRLLWSQLRGARQDGTQP